MSMLTYAEMLYKLSVVCRHQFTQFATNLSLVSAEMAPFNLACGNTSYTGKSFCCY